VRLGIPSSSLLGFEDKISFIDEQGQKKVIYKGMIDKIDLPAVTKHNLEIAAKVYNEVMGIKTKPAAEKVEFGPTVKESFPEMKITKEEIAPVKEEQKITPEEKTEIDLVRQGMARILAENESFLKQIIAEEKNILTASQGEVEKLKNYFFEGYRNKESNVVLACLLILARQAELKNIIFDPSVQEIFEKDIFPILSKQTPAVDLQSLINNFRQDKENEIYLKIFLKFIISRILTEGGQAAYLGWQMENIFRALSQNSYLGLVYYNLGSSQFEWAMVKVNEDGSLVME